MLKKVLAYAIVSLSILACKPDSESDTNAIAAGDSFVLTLMYHDIFDENRKPEGFKIAPDDVTLKNFQEQLDWLQSNGYETISAFELYNSRANNRKFTSKKVFITFDDNYYGVYKYAIPELEKRNMKATIFAHTAYVRRDGEQVDYTKVRPKASWPEMVEVETKRGKGELFRFESHTVNHLDLTKLSDEKITFELAESKKIIEAKFKEVLRDRKYRDAVRGHHHADSNGNKVVRHIAYPYGGYKESVGRISRQVGYFLGFEVGFEEDFGHASFALPRQGIGISVKNISDFENAVRAYERNRTKFQR